jgi:hypothetical protein
MRFLMLALITFAACGKGDEPPGPTTGVPGAPTESGPKPHGTPADEIARGIFGSKCVACHGFEGKGDGPAAESLQPRPRDYTDTKWQASVTDEDLKKTIVLGGKGVGKSPLMPGNPDLANKPEVVEGLIKIIRGFAKK